MNTLIPTLPDMHTRAAILLHVEHTLSFYHPRAIDPSGGFYHFLKDDGTVFDAHTRHLVSSTRYVFLTIRGCQFFISSSFLGYSTFFSSLFFRDCLHRQFHFVRLHTFLLEP